MIANRNYEQCAPLTWVGKVPVYLATAIAAAHGVALILCAFALAGGANGLLAALRFSPESAIGGLQLWQFFTYAFVTTNPNDFLWVALQLFMLAVFGREVEKFVGRASFAWLYGILLLAPPAFLSLVHLIGDFNYPYAGSGTLHFAIFIAFAYIYPRAEIFFGIEARWIALVLVGIYSLMLLAAVQPVNLGLLWLECAVAVLWMMREGVGSFTLPSPSAFFKRKHSERKLKVVRKEPKNAVEVHESIDPILEKIASRGMSSLTKAERETLERARVALLEKERQG
jgi:hypothetical protein